MCILLTVVSALSPGSVLSPGELLWHLPMRAQLASGARQCGRKCNSTQHLQRRTNVSKQQYLPSNTVFWPTTVTLRQLLFSSPYVAYRYAPDSGFRSLLGPPHLSPRTCIRATARTTVAVLTNCDVTLVASLRSMCLRARSRYKRSCVRARCNRRASLTQLLQRDERIHFGYPLAKFISVWTNCNSAIRNVLNDNGGWNNDQQPNCAPLLLSNYCSPLPQ